MPAPYSCPSCQYPLEGLETSRGAKCPECGKRFTWHELEEWQRQGQYIPPPELGHWLWGTPVLIFLGYLADAATLGNTGGFGGAFLGWLWATFWCGVMAHHSMRRHGEAFSKLMLVLMAPTLGLAVVLLSLLPVGLLAAALNAW